MLRILYVEDNAANLSLVHRVARVGGHEVVNRTSGESALADFASIAADIVLMDIQLEGKMSGLDVVRKLRADGYTDVPIIAVTAYAMKGDREKAIDAGCDDYLPKPLPIKELVDLITKYEARIKKHKTGEIAAVRAIEETQETEKQPDEAAVTDPADELPPSSIPAADDTSGAGSEVGPTASTAESISTTTEPTSDETTTTTTAETVVVPKVSTTATTETSTYSEVNVVTPDNVEETETTAPSPVAATATDDENIGTDTPAATVDTEQPKIKKETDTAPSKTSENSISPNAER